MIQSVSDLHISYMLRSHNLTGLQILRRKYTHRATQHSLVKLDLATSCQIEMMETTYTAKATRQIPKANGKKQHVSCAYQPISILINHSVT
jgi:hypothetical protein